MTVARSIVFSVGILLAVQAYAQTGAVRGQVIDEKEQPVGSVEIVLEFLGGINREFKTTSDDQGSFVRIGLPIGRYKLTFSKAGHQSYEYEVRVPPGAPTQVGKVILPTLPEGARSDKELEDLSAAVTPHFEKGVAAVDAGDYGAAVAAFEKVLELNPDSVEAAYNLGLAHEKLGELDQAVSYYQKAIELESGYVEPYVALGHIYAANQQWPEALEMLQKAAELQPEDVSILFNLGAAAMNTGNIAVAQEAFEKVITLDGDHALGHYQLGMVFVNQAKSEEAVVHLEKYLELEPEGKHAATASGILDYLKKN
jgi:Flp pilus assembly protein TadD